MCSTPGLQKSRYATLKAEMWNSEAKATEQLSKDRKRRYLRSHWSMEAKCDSSSAKGRQSIAVLSGCCEPSDRFWVLYKEGNAPPGTAQVHFIRLNILCFLSSRKSLSLSAESKTDPLGSTNTCSWTATHPLAPSDFGEEVLNLI